MKRTVVLPVSQAKEGRKTLALENYLIRFFERELEVKLTRREMWRSVSFFARSLAFLEKNPHLCNDFHLKQATRFANKAVGIFYAYRLMLYKFRPVWSVNAPTACFRWKATGSGTFFVPSPCLYFIYSF
ncbi:hypothetical protein [Barnesiella intestinihominis]|uniref:hypothetical protein n=1 Tax=Barnesiella intestinihominis TaxID=487174 RepID=UPI002430C747|nr:hypothetical protein [Barnesiella intestinihominis]